MEPNAVTSSHPRPPLVEGRSQVDRRERKKETKRNGGSGQRPKGRETKVRIFFCYTLPCFFVNFGGLSLPCHLHCCLLLFVLFFGGFLGFFTTFFPSLIFWGFFYLHEFSGGGCNFNCSWHYFTSSGHVPLGVGCTAPPFRGRVSKGSKLCN